jgi:hypothetical protein
MRRTHRAQRTPNSSLTPLLVQAGAARTLGSIVSALSIILLCLGAYLLAEAIRHPLEAQPAEIIGAAVMITLGATMLFFLYETRSASTRIVHRHRAMMPVNVLAVATPQFETSPRADTQRELPLAPRW